ncbi:phosphate ABC transporter permease [Brachybacterium phenoliresistens]|uniref:Transport permease protein n=1 Tax=Brachybacterium phenoliresistens TaxID=396014 RepID=Z9JUH1_9MICO|nr:ABC transporter permease [Brachybacterium phenoliresistens]EWS81412.1 phosphate ABC transporter permease [Brachybacterium phenoliresistens]
MPTASEPKDAQQIIATLESRGLRAENLSPVGVRPSLDAYVAQLWERRHFIWMDARHRVVTQNSRNRLGNIWLLLRPLMDAAFYFLIFGVILKTTREGIDNFAAYLIIGVLMFRATSTAITSAPSSLHNSRAMIRAFSFPRAAIPISAVLRQGMQMLWAVGAMLVMIMVLGEHELPNIMWPMILPVLALQWMMNLGLSFIFARLGFQIPDVSQLMSFVSRVLMYGSGVIFPIERFLTHPVAASVIQVNPVYQMLRAYRGILQHGTMPPPDAWLILGAWSLGLLVGGFVYFWRGEASYGGGQ